MAEAEHHHDQHAPIPGAHLAQSDDQQEDKVPNVKDKRLADMMRRTADLDTALADICARRADLETNWTHDGSRTALDEAKAVIKEHIRLLHDYNEIRDVGQGLFGIIAESRGVRVKDIHEEFGISTKD
ncbi:Swi5-domain-containing protein [Phyllosticta citrichinensis]|uniref:Swi5-domain-containing protein n=1 Tax=Phyllosticta citrichinensis TaxID=1130410 RepID=A0ABR1XX18_9PEZI